MSYIPTRYPAMSTPAPPCAQYVLRYLTTPLCPLGAYVWTPSKLMARRRLDYIFGRSWTDARPGRLRGKIAVTSHIVCMVSFYIHFRRPTYYNPRVCTWTVCLRKTKLVKKRQGAPPS
eukprot:2512529-Pleurochrysis_carterae.AAC.2